MYNYTTKIIIVRYNWKWFLGEIGQQIQQKGLLQNTVWVSTWFLPCTCRTKTMSQKEMIRKTSIQSPGPGQVPAGTWKLTCKNNLFFFNQYSFITCIHHYKIANAADWQQQNMWTVDRCLAQNWLSLCHTLLPQCGSFQRALCWTSAIFIPGTQAASPAPGSGVSEMLPKLWLFFLVVFGAFLTPIPSPRSPSNMSSSRLQASLTPCICTRLKPKPAKPHSELLKLKQFIQNTQKTYFLTSSANTFYYMM